MAVFISYRREDSQHITDRIYDKLLAHLGKGQIFKDLDSIPPGADFRQVIVEAIAKCSALLVVIGSQWLTVVDEEGNPRLHNSNDYVRIEIETALQRGARVIPLLIDRTMLEPLELPESLRDLAFRHAVIIRPDPDFHRDMERLLAALQTTEEDLPTLQLRILVVDDSNVNRALAKSLMSKEGHIAHIVSSQEKALAVAQGEELDLILLQVQLPNGEGYQLIKAIRQLEGPQGLVPIVGMTSDPSAQEQGMEAGMNGHIPRPLRVTDLQTAIQEYVQTLDFESALQAVAGDPHLLSHLIELTINDYPRQLEDIQNGLKDGDARFIQSRAHTLKGTFYTIGAKAAEAAALKIEQAARDNDLSNLPTLIAALIRQIDLILPIFGRITKKYPPTELT